MPIIIRILVAFLPMLLTAAHAAEPDTVFFPSADGTTQLVGYLFKPAGPGPYAEGCHAYRSCHHALLCPALELAHRYGAGPN